jgi:hypothetical protein
MNNQEQLKDYIERYPTYDIKFMVDVTTVDDSYTYNTQKIRYISITEYREWNNKVYTDLEDLMEDMMYQDEELSEEDAEDRAANMLDQVIIVTLGN